MHAALITLDIALVIGAALRITRFIVYDHLGDWWIVQPIESWARNRRNPDLAIKYVKHLLDCPFCIGQWVAGAVVLSLLLVGGPGDAADWWRWVAAIFALNYVQGHINARLDG